MMTQNAVATGEVFAEIFRGCVAAESGGYAANKTNFCDTVMAILSEIGGDYGDKLDG